MNTSTQHDRIAQGINTALFEASLYPDESPVMAELVRFLNEISVSSDSDKSQTRPSEFYAYVDGVEGVVIF